MAGAWYPLDGTWHKGVASKMSALHAKYSTTGGALCDNNKWLLDDDSYSEAEAEAAGRTLCRSCLRAAGIKPNKATDRGFQKV